MVAIAPLSYSRRMLRPALAVAVVCLAVFAGCPPSGRPVPLPPGPPQGSGFQSGAAAGAPCDAASDCASGICEGEGCGAAAGRCAESGRVCTADAVEYCGCDGVTFAASGSCPNARFAARGACAPAAGADGAPCLDSAECTSGVCEGLGCGPDAPGVCVSAQRACTRDYREYCGCDGLTFGGSGSCPGRRYQAVGACAPRPAGAACLANSDCESGACEGQGCGPDTPGVCAARQRACTRDLRAYCGCDGQTFKGSGSCPGNRYAHKGACASAP